MLKSKYYILTVLVCILFMSCEKEQQRLTDAPSSPEDALVKTKTEKGITETYYYDSQKRISKILFNTGSTSYFHEFTYSSNEIQEYKSVSSTNKTPMIYPIFFCILKCFLRTFNS